MTKAKNSIAAIILAAGLGKRMKSNIPKVLHPLSGKPMILRTIEILNSVEIDQTIVVAGYKSEQVKKALEGKIVDFAFQKDQLGTAHAAQSGLAKLKKEIDTVLVLNGDDSAFYKPQTLKNLIKDHLDNKNVLTFATVEVGSPSGLGRVVKKNNKPIAIIEEKEANDEQKKIKEINCGLYVFQKDWLVTNIKSVQKSKISQEYYLVNLIEKAISTKQKVGAYKIKNPNEWFGINSPQQLQLANKLFRSKREKIHIMGAAGSGASAIFQIAQKFGYSVTGCDINKFSSYSKDISSQLKEGHSKSHLKNIDMLIISEAILRLDPENEEIKEAKKLNIPILLWEQFQSQFLQKDKFVIAVAGAYGKSTTTAMISKILTDTGFDPTCEIGATVLEWRSNFRVGESNYYVCEVDEYYDKFLNYNPNIAVILNIAWDHPDFFKSKEDLKNSYIKFINNIKPNGTLIIANEVSDQLNKFIRSDIKIIKIINFSNVRLSIIGDFRSENADAALTLAKTLKIDPQTAKKSVGSFKGLGRRLEFKGQIANCKVYDDYAVQPYTILKTANALKERYPASRLVLVFEPHTFSRVKFFFKDFVRSLQKVMADKILITSVFAAREAGDTIKLSQNLVKAVGPKAMYTGTIEKTAEYLKQNIKDFDLILSMGAGNIYKIYDLIKK